MDLKWAQPESHGADAFARYEFRYSLGATVTGDPDWTVTSEGTSITRRRVTGLTNGLLYAFEVRAVNDADLISEPATVTATPVAAVCAMPDYSGGRRQIYAGTVTVVGFNTDFGGVTRLGYGFDAYEADAEGSSLEPTVEFNIGENQLLIDSVAVGKRTQVMVGGRVRLILDGELTELELAALRLHVCDAHIDFSDADESTSDPEKGELYWRDTDLDWDLVRTRNIYLSLPANNAATGAPAITGTTVVGQTLTATAGDIADADGLPEEAESFSYQWVRVDADGVSNPVDISGATADSYTLVAADGGKKIKVKATFTDLLGGVETRTSGATDTVQLTPLAVTGVAVTSTPAYMTDTYGAHEYIEISVTFNRAATATGEPTFALAVGSGNAKTALYTRGSGTDTLVFSYQVKTSDTDTDGISWAANALTFTVTPALTHDAQSALSGHKVNGANAAATATVSVAVTSTPLLTSSGASMPDTYGAGETIVFTATFSEAVAVAGDPEFQFSLGSPGESSASSRRRATYDSARSTATMVVFVYTVVPTDVDPNGIWVGDQTRTFKLDGDDRILTVSGSGVGANLAHSGLNTLSGHKVDGSQAYEALRLVDGAEAHEGRLEIFYNGEWGTICDDYWTDVEADVACRILGYPHGSVDNGGRFRRAHFGQGTGPIWLDNVNCEGDETSLLDCPRWNGIENYRIGNYLAVGTNNCKHSEDVGVRCKTTAGFQLEAAAVVGPPSVSTADGGWGPGETVEVTLTFSEAVTVDTTAGTPSVGLLLSGTDERAAAYLRGSGTTELVFGYTLTDADGSHTSLLVPLDSLVLNGGTIRSQSTGTDAVLGHDGVAKMAEPVQPRDEADGPTARFDNLPESHDGSTPFTVELHFSDEPEGLSYTTVGGGLLSVSGGAVTGARRLTQGSNQGWAVTVEPSQDDVVITLPARACGKTHAVCFAGRPLSQAVSATVPERVLPPLTASFADVPDEHDGATPFVMAFRLSEEPDGLSYVTVRDALFVVTGGSIAGVSRLEQGSDAGWRLRVAPAGLGDVRFQVLATTACDTAPGVCTADGRMLAAGAEALIAGPAVLSVDDAQVEEASGAALDFVVTLSRQRSTATTVDYATSNGTGTGAATAGVDYTTASGTLTFAAGETTRTVSVAVLDDGHDEGEETLTLTLSNPQGARLDDATATGTITNNDPMPKAWMARFGRTVGSQVVEAVSSRLDGRPAASRFTVGGVSLGAGTARDAAVLAPQDRLAAHLAQEPDAQRPAERSLTGRDLLLGSSFHLVSQPEASGGAVLSAWGRLSTGGFRAALDGVTLDGDVTTGLLGFDAEWERLLAGLLLARSDGSGAYALDDGGERGSLESTITGVYPYARLRLSHRVSAWGVAGVGSGDLRLRLANEAIDTGLGLRLGAIGVKGMLLEGAALALSVKSDALWVRTESDAALGLAGAAAQVSRLRLILEAERTLMLWSGAVLTPTLQVGVRHDGGDAERGTGVEVGAGFRYRSGLLTLEGQVRTLLAHASGDYEEWGASGALRLSPDASGLGASLAVLPSWGASASGVARLWSSPDASAPSSPGAASSPGGRLDAELGYGLRALRGRGVLTPYARVGLVESESRSWHLGARLALAESLTLSLEGSRRRRQDAASAHDVALRASVPW